MTNAASSVKPPTPEPSEHFWEAFGSGVGSPSLVCVCGRAHYAPDSAYVEEMELAEMERHAKERPEKVVMHHGEDGVSAKVIGGMTIVPGCPCGWFGNFEALLWRERDRVLRYYRIRRDAEAKTSAALDTELAAVEGAK